MSLVGCAKQHRLLVLVLSAAVLSNAVLVLVDSAVVIQQSFIHLLGFDRLSNERASNRCGQSAYYRSTIVDTQVRVGVPGYALSTSRTMRWNAVGLIRTRTQRSGTQQRGTRTR